MVIDARLDVGEDTKPCRRCGSDDHATAECPFAGDDRMADVDDHDERREGE
jgi:hypothetical protein